jgi:hypothetical protein
MIRNGIIKTDMLELNLVNVGFALESVRYSVNNIMIMHAEATPTREKERI